MLSRNSALTFLLVVGLVRSQASQRENGSITWFPCEQNGTLPWTCGSLSVPLDYTDENTRSLLDLSLVRVNATKSPKKGSILFNEGGPGFATRDFIASFAETLMFMTGGYFDLIGSDPRGTGTTIPYSCYDNNNDRLAVTPYLEVLANASDTALGTQWAFSETLAENCYQTMGDNGELVGTAFVARDMMQIVDALGEDGLLRFWGLSYGSILGATVAAMFPDRMDKVIIDGVVNAPEYYAGRIVEESTATDTVLLKFFESCLDEPEGCALARPNVTAEQLLSEVWDLIDAVKLNPIVLGSNATTDVVTYSPLKTTILTSMRSPLVYWPNLAALLDAIYTKNLTNYLTYNAMYTPLTDTSSFPNYGYEASVGIQCSETAFRTDNLSSLDPFIDELYNTSRLIGDVMAAWPLSCGCWKMQAKERYDGNFNATTKNPMLIIGSPFDPLTPLVSAQNTSTMFEGSVVLQHNGYGHASISHPSTCTINAIQAYFVNGTLPQPGTVCEPDTKPFTDRTSSDSSGASSSTKKTRRDLKLPYPGPKRLF